MVDHSIKGKTVLIAGGAKNLGGLIARDLAVHGAGQLRFTTTARRVRPMPTIR